MFFNHHYLNNIKIFIIQKKIKINIHYYLFHIYIRIISYLENYMNNVNKNKESDVKLVKHFIKDLSFENPQHINELNANNNNDNSVDINMNILHETYKNSHFSLVLKYILD